jgi:hypothetical protein
MDEKLSENLRNISEKWRRQGLSSLSEEELIFLRDHVHTQEHKNDFMLEIQRKQTNFTIKEMQESNKQMAKSVEWSKWMTRATLVMTIATALMALITLIK